MPKISKRSGEVPLSPFRKLVPYADKAKREGKQVYHLNIGQPDIETPASSLKRLRELELKVVAYSPAVGLLSYRKKLAAHYDKQGIALEPDHFIICCGASEAIQFLMFACLDEGDEVIIPEPFYANYSGFIRVAGGTIQPLESKLSDGFALPTIDHIEKRINHKTRAIFITNPSNPTGTFYGEKDLQQLAHLARKYDLYLIVDEVYSDFCYDGRDFISALSLKGSQRHVVVVDSISKRYSACGARIGCIVSRNAELLEIISRYAKLRLSPPVFGQMLGEALLDVKGDYLREVRVEYDRRRQLVYSRLQQMKGVVSYLPGGAFYCFAGFPVDDAERFCRWMLEEFSHEGATVMLSPGEGFYATPGRGRQEVRIAYILKLSDLEMAMDCLEAGLLAYPYRTDYLPDGKPMFDTANKFK
ncbi:MAG: pyridoxal phosphate-dependent aminotransferase [Saprospiraceae bacterium]|nr:pyridoxal phosphate-dependent aminotransferase [Saprospiraceae bacterium]